MARPAAAKRGSIQPAQRLFSLTVAVFDCTSMKPAKLTRGNQEGPRELVAHCVRETRIAKCARRANEAASSARNRGALPH
ncbi:hypothetical protein J3E68DRAFT_406119 [Trichoderma sp. SZMC 28012]